MANFIEDYLILSVTACKRLGYFIPKAKASGVVRWTRERDGNTVEIASIQFETNLTGTVPYAVLTYNYKGTPVRTEITLRFRPSNLNNGTGYYYFVCPVTGLSCRKLYLVNGRFVGRVAFRPLYPQQAESHKQRDLSTYTLMALGAYEDLLNKPYRRLTYRGRLTPWGRKVEKMGKRVGALYEKMNHRVQTKGWDSV